MNLLQNIQLIPNLCTVNLKDMSNFYVKVIYENGKPAKDIAVMIDYGLFGGTDKKRTHSDGWVEFHNRENKSGYIWVDGHKMGNHSLENGKTYSFTI